MNRHFGEVQLLGGFPAGMADDDDAVGIDDDRLPETEVVDGLDDGGNRIVVDSRILFVRLDPIKRPRQMTIGVLCSHARSMTTRQVCFIAAFVRFESSLWISRITVAFPVWFVLQNQICHRP